MDHAIKAAIAFAMTCLVACSSDDGKPSSGTGGDTARDAATEPGEDGGAQPGTKKGNAEVGCNGDGECESNVCFKGKNQSFCTVRCTADDAATVCVAPFTGSCNKQGYCKRD